MTSLSPASSSLGQINPGLLVGSHGEPHVVPSAQGPTGSEQSRLSAQNVKYRNSPPQSRGRMGRRRVPTHQVWQPWSLCLVRGPTGNRLPPRCFLQAKGSKPHPKTHTSKIRPWQIRANIWHQSRPGERGTGPKPTGPCRPGLWHRDPHPGPFPERVGIPEVCPSISVSLCHLPSLSS